MAKRAKTTTVFLIVDDNDQRNKLATGLHEMGYNVYDDMTARKFLIAKRNHSSGGGVADYPPFHSRRKPTFSTTVVPTTR